MIFTGKTMLLQQRERSFCPGGHPLSMPVFHLNIRKREGDMNQEEFQGVCKQLLEFQEGRLG